MVLVRTRTSGLAVMADGYLCEKIIKIFAKLLDNILRKNILLSLEIGGNAGGRRRQGRKPLR